MDLCVPRLDYLCPLLVLFSQRFFFCLSSKVIFFAKKVQYYLGERGNQLLSEPEIPPPSSNTCFEFNDKICFSKTVKWTDKRFAEFQRNVWLLLGKKKSFFSLHNFKFFLKGQFSFLVLVPMASVVSNTVCESFGALTLLFWSLFFTWSGR